MVLLIVTKLASWKISRPIKTCATQPDFEPTTFRMVVRTLQMVILLLNPSLILKGFAKFHRSQDDEK